MIKITMLSLLLTGAVLADEVPFLQSRGTAVQLSQVGGRFFAETKTATFVPGCSSPTIVIEKKELTIEQVTAVHELLVSGDLAYAVKYLGDQQ